MSNPICPYCGAASSLVSGDYIYPHRPDLAAKQFYTFAPTSTQQLMSVATGQAKNHLDGWQMPSFGK